MSQTLTKAMTRPGVGPAFLAAVGVFAGLLLLNFLHSLLNTAAILNQTSGDYVGQLWFSLLLDSVTGPLPFAIGIFLSFWQIAPVAASLRLAHVVSRSVLATVLAAILLWVVSFVPQVVDVFLHSRVNADPSTVVGPLGTDALNQAIGALNTAVGYLPVALLGGIFLWGWLQRHPSATPARGALDEV